MANKKRYRSPKEQMMRRNNSVRARLRRLVGSGKSAMEAARIVGVGYDCALQWTRDLKREPPTGGPAIPMDDNFVPKPPTEPTSSLVGSMARVEVYRQRVDDMEGLYHPWDNPLMQRPKE